MLKQCEVIPALEAKIVDGAFYYVGGYDAVVKNNATRLMQTARGSLTNS